MITFSPLVSGTRKHLKNINSAGSPGAHGSGSPGAHGFSGERAEAGLTVTTKYRELYQGSVISPRFPMDMKTKEGQQQL